MPAKKLISERRNKKFERKLNNMTTKASKPVIVEKQKKSESKKKLKAEAKKQKKMKKKL